MSRELELPLGDVRAKAARLPTVVFLAMSIAGCSNTELDGSGRGVRAASGHQIFTSDPEHLTREQIEHTVKQQAVQGAITAGVSKVEKETRSGAGSISSESRGGFIGQYQQGWSGAYAPAAANSQYDVVTVDVQLFDVDSSELVSPGVTRTVDPSNLERSTRDWARIVIEALEKRAIIARLNSASGHGLPASES